MAVSVNYDQSSSHNDNIKYLQDQLTIARKEISNLRQQIKSLGFINQKEYESLRQRLSDIKCDECQSNHSELEVRSLPFDLSSLDDRLLLKPIGTITTQFPEKRCTPRQAGICSESVAKITLDNDIFTNPEHALEGLNEFSHIWILFYFHKNESTHMRAKVAPPRLNGVRTGVFATRSPHRPSPIGLSLVKLERIDGYSLYFSGVDMIDGTPVLDIKPYIPQYDSPVPNFSLLSPELSSSRRLDGRETVDDSLSSHDGDGSVIESFPTTRSEIVRPESRIGVREAPDGEECELSTPASTASNFQPAMSSSQADVKVPSWINEPPISQLNVNFSERAITQLQAIKSSMWEQTKKAITNILKEDPRSVYLRTRWSNQFYTFRIAEVHVSCKFDDALHTVTVFQIRDADTLEDN